VYLDVEQHVEQLPLVVSEDGVIIDVMNIPANPEPVIREVVEGLAIHGLF
jgi:hypothetical protein